MSTIKLPAPPPASTAASASKNDRLRVITAGRVGNVGPGLRTSGFDVVAVAETEDALIDAIAADQPEAIVVESELCSSLEHIRDLAPDAVLIVVGDHTPAGALGRIERGMSGTMMARLLRALVAEGVGAAVLWGLVPAFRRSVAPRLAAASTIAVTASASLLLALGTPSTLERPDRVPFPDPIVEPSPPRSVVTMSPATTHPIVAVSPATRTPGLSPSKSGLSPSKSEAMPGDRRGPRPHASTNPGRDQRGSPSGAARPPATSDASRPPGVANGWDRRPPKHADNGHRIGWSDNSVPEDLPPGSEKHGQSEERGRRGPP